MQIERDSKLELSRRLRLDRVPPAGASLDIEAGAGERAALVRRFAVLDILELKAQVNLIAEGGGRWQVSGRLQATVVQACGITLDPVEQRIDEVFNLRFAPPAEAVDDDTGELIVGADAPEP
ncbi:MAG TPA: hypothetical protein VJ890_19345, partial [Vineibacter sp.]|nr:hypothetical protein [Vineibacter sp.]